MVLSDITANLTEWFVLKEVKQEEEKKDIKKEDIKNEIYIVLINDKPYGYYYDEEETKEQLRQAQEYVLGKHLYYTFDRYYFWLPIKDEDCIVKTKLISSVIGTYDRIEEVIEIIKSTLLPVL